MSSSEYPPPPQTLLSLALTACLLPLLPILIWKQEAARIAQLVGIFFVCPLWGGVLGGGCWKLEILRWNLSVSRSHVTILVQTDTVVQPQRWFGSKLIWPVSVWFCRFVCTVEEFIESKNGKYHLQYLFNQVWPDSQHLMINQITMNTVGDKRQDYFFSFFGKEKRFHILLRTFENESNARSPDLLFCLPAHGKNAKLTQLLQTSETSLLNCAHIGSWRHFLSFSYWSPLESES